MVMHMDEIKEGVDRIESTGKSMLAKLGPYFFLFGIIIAIIVGLLVGAETIDTTEDNWGYIAAVLAGLGFLVGLISAIGIGTITKEEITQFLIAATAIVAVGIGGNSLFVATTPVIGDYIAGVTLCMVLFFAPAAIIIALKTLWDLGKD
jgi:hypothetical protein